MAIVSFYIWQGDDVAANVFHSYKMPNGKDSYGLIGQTPIKEGDIVLIDYGTERQVYTRSGRGYEMQYQYGLMKRYCDGASLELNGNTVVFIKNQQREREIFEQLVQIQKEKYLPDIENLVVQYQKKLMLQNSPKDYYKQSNLINPKKLEETMDKMDNILKNIKRKP